MPILESLGRMIGRVRPASVVNPAPAISERGYLDDQIRIYNSTRLRLTPGFSSLTNPTDETAEMRRTYPALLKEPTLKAAFFGSMFSVGSLDLVVTPADDTSDKDREIAEFVYYYIMGRRTSCLHLIESLGYGGRIYGFSVTHKKKKKETRGKWAGKIVIDEFKPKPVGENKIMLEVDEYNNLSAIQSAWPNRPGERYDPADFIVFTYLKLFGSLTGMSDFRAARRACLLKESAIKLRMIALDKFTGPYIKGTYPAKDESTRLYLEKALKNARSEGYITLPEGSDIEVIDLAMKTATEFKQAIDDFDREIAVSTNFASLHMFTSAQSDPRGDTKVQQQTSEIGNWYVAALIADALQTQVVPEAVDLNYGTTFDLPIVTIGGVNADDILRELKVDDLLHSMGGGLVMSDLYRRAGRPVPAGSPEVLPGSQPFPIKPTATKETGGPALPFADVPALNAEAAELIRAAARLMPDVPIAALPVPASALPAPLHVHLPRPGKRKETQTVKRDGNENISETITVVEDAE